jgi:hypothetical protein
MKTSEVIGIIVAMYDNHGKLSLSENSNCLAGKMQAFIDVVS